MSRENVSKAARPGVRALLGILALVAIVAAVSDWRGDGATTKEQEAEQRAAALREQSLKESPAPVTPEVVVDPDSPPTRGPMGSPSRR